MAPTPVYERHLSLITPLFKQLQPQTQEEKRATAIALARMVGNQPNYLEGVPKRLWEPLNVIHERLQAPERYESSPRLQTQFLTVVVHHIQEKIDVLGHPERELPSAAVEECSLL